MLEKGELLSVVVPCYNEEEVLNDFYNTLKTYTNQIHDQYGIDVEYICIDDGSKDETLTILRKLNQEDDNCHYISFSRNFGKEAGIYAGIKDAKGDYVVLMDADFQDPPELLPKMMAVMNEKEVDCVCAKKTSRKGESFAKRIFTRIFYKLLNQFGQVKLENGIRDYRLMTRKMVDAVVSMAEVNRFSKGIFAWVGFSNAVVEYEHANRKSGKSKWSFINLLHYGINGIVGYTTSPLIFAALLGAILFLISIIAIIIVVIRKLVYGDTTQGWASLVCIILFVSSIQLLCIGIIGEYLSKLYMEVKNRPLYIIAESSKVKEYDETEKR